MFSSRHGCTYLLLWLFPQCGLQHAAFLFCAVLKLGVIALPGDLVFH